MFVKVVELQKSLNEKLDVKKKEKFRIVADFLLWTNCPHRPNIEEHISR